MTRRHCAKPKSLLDPLRRERASDRTLGTREVPAHPTGVSPLLGHYLQNKTEIVEEDFIAWRVRAGSQSRLQNFSKTAESSSSTGVRGSRGIRSNMPRRQGRHAMNIRKR